MSFGAFEALESLLRGHHQRLHPTSYPKTSSSSSSSAKVSTTQTTTSFAELRRRSRTAASYSTAARMSSLSSSLSGGIKDSQQHPASSSAPTAAMSSSSVSDRLVPSANLNENRDCVRVLVDLPGVPAQDVHVTLEHGVLEISGTRRIMSDDGSTCLKRQKFGRRYAIDVDVVDVAKATAVLSNGVLTVRAPKKDERSQSLVRIPVVDASAVATAGAVNPGPDEAAAAAALVPVRDEGERVEPTTRPTLIPNVPPPPPTNRPYTALTSTSSSSSSLSAKSSLSDASASPTSIHHHPSPPLPPPLKRRVKTSVTAADPIRAYVTRGRRSSQHHQVQPQQEQQPQSPLPPMPSESSSTSSSSASSSSTSTSSDATPTTGNPCHPTTTTLEGEEEEEVR